MSATSLSRNWPLTENQKENRDFSIFTATKLHLTSNLNLNEVGNESSPRAFRNGYKPLGSLFLAW
jgi:hypothetical protein